MVNEYLKAFSLLKDVASIYVCFISMAFKLNMVRLLLKIDVYLLLKKDVWLENNFIICPQ